MSAHLRLRLAAFAELIRVPNVFTAAADVMMGALFVGIESTPRGAAVVGLLAVASALLYAGGVALNDSFDAPRDARERPNRPIPSGRIRRHVAFQIGGGFLLAGVVVAVAAGSLAASWRTALVVVLLAGTILCYDAWAKRTPLGPMAMGLCRGLNVLLGMSVAAGALTTVHYWIAGALAIYVAGLTWFARREEARSPRALLVAGALIMLAGIAMLAALPELGGPLTPEIAANPSQWRLLILILGAMTAWRCLHAIIEPSPVQVQTTVAHGIFSLVILDAAICFAARGMLAAVVILLMLAPALLLSRWTRMS